MKVSSLLINEICEPLGTQTDEITRWCNWMKTETPSLDSNEPAPVEDGVTLNSTQNVAILGARMIFKAKAREALSKLQSQPNFQNILDTTYAYILYLEGTLPTIATSFLDFMKFKTGHSKLIAGERIPRNKIITQPSRSYADLERFLSDTFLADHCLMNNVKSEGLSRERSEILKSLGFDPDVDHVDFENWNTTIAALLTKYLHDFVFARIGEVEKRSTVLEVGSFLQSSNFVFMTTLDVKSILETMRQYGFGYILTKSSAKIEERKVAGRTKLSDDEIQAILKVVKYPGVHPLIAGPIEAKVRSALASQLEEVKLEPKFIPQLAVLTQEHFDRARVHKGHRSGMIAAMSMGEDASQAGLRSFHHAGVTGDSGFDRVKFITDNPAVEKAKGTFTIIALKGMPTAKEASVYATKIEETRISDVCTITIGRTSDKVPDMSDIFQGTPVFDAEKEGWQQRYVDFFIKLKEEARSPIRPSFDRPDWIVRLTCDTNIMYQKRITPAIIAESIEQAYTKFTAIPSDFKTGIVDVYVDVSGTSHAKDNPDAKAYTQLSIDVVPQLASRLIQGIVGFSKAFIEKYSITSMISSIKKSGDDHIVSFNERDVALNGVPENQIVNFMIGKAGTAEVQVAPESRNTVFKIKGFKGNFRERILAPEVVKLSDAVLSTFADNNVFIAVLDRKFLRLTHDVSTIDIIDFFAKQNALDMFKSVDITFDRTKFEVQIKKSTSFTPELVAEGFKRFDISESIRFERNVIIFEGVRDGVDLTRFQMAVDSYGTTMTIDADRDSKTIRLNLYPLSLTGTWEMLLNVSTGCEILPTTFESRKKQRLSERYRILAKGIGLGKLSYLPFVNIYATTSSVPMEHYQYFDIEATRDYINSEFVLNVGADVGDRHLGLISDVMCYVGVPIKIKLSGKRATFAGPLATASLQESLKLLVDASAARAQDELKSSVGMTLIGDFQRGKFATDEKTKIDETESAIALLMSSTPSSRTVIPTKKKDVEIETKTKVQAEAPKEDPFAGFTDPNGGI